MVSGVHNVRVGQKIMVNFDLDDQKGTPLKKQTVVRSVDRTESGANSRKTRPLRRAWVSTWDLSRKFRSISHLAA